MAVRDSLDAINAAQSRAAERLAQDNRNLRKLIDVSIQIATLNLSASLQMIIESVVGITQAQRGFVMLTDAQNHLEIKSSFAMPKVDPQDFEICQSVAQYVSQNARAELIENIRIDPRYKDHRSVVALDLKAVMCVPLRIGDDCIGIIYVDSDRSAHRFSNDDLELFEAFASQAAVAIVNARQFQHVKKQNLHLRQAVVDKYSFSSVVSISQGMQNVFQMAKRVLDIGDRR